MNFKNLDVNKLIWPAVLIISGIWIGAGVGAFAAPMHAEKIFDSAAAATILPPLLYWMFRR